MLLKEVKPGEKRLFAYVVCNQDQSPPGKEPHNYLKQKLPDYMIPHTFVVLSAFPLTSGGKIDRLALSESDHRKSDLDECWPASDRG